MLKVLRDLHNILINFLKLLSNDKELMSVSIGEHKEKNQDNSSSSKIKVSTIITTYNHKKFIREAIESSINQVGNFEHEIIIYDDGSTDNAPSIIREYEKKYPNLIINISETCNVGISQNMKRAFARTTGKYVAVLEGMIIGLPLIN